MPHLSFIFHRIRCYLIDPPAPCLGDWECDGDIDLVDFAHMPTCMTGPLGGVLGPGCETFDLDGDIDVDLEDFAGFQGAFTGSSP